MVNIIIRISPIGSGLSLRVGSLRGETPCYLQELSQEQACKGAFGSHPLRFAVSAGPRAMTRFRAKVSQRSKMSEPKNPL